MRHKSWYPLLSGTESGGVTVMLRFVEEWGPWTKWVFPCDLLRGSAPYSVCDSASWVVLFLLNVRRWDVLQCIWLDNPIVLWVNRMMASRRCARCKCRRLRLLMRLLLQLLQLLLLSLQKNLFEVELIVLLLRFTRVASSLFHWMNWKSHLQVCRSTLRLVQCRW